MNEILEQSIATLGLVGSMTSQDMLVELYDNSLKLVYCDSSNGVPARLSVGDVASDDDDFIREAMTSGSKQFRTDSGIEYNYVPVMDGMVAVGCVVTSYAAVTGGGSNEAAIEKAEVFMECIDKITNSVDMMGIHFENLFDELQSMQEKTGSIEKDVTETSDVVAKIRANASKSKILALNASIEAARSGEAGKGFTVVAKEMGEMATASGTSASEINEALKSIFGHLNEITTSITDANGLADKQTASIREIEECLGEALQAAMELGEALQQG